ncbi:MAG: DUF1016 N-terminal domain-containing protein [Solirubrobacterales bacterium]
MVERSLLWSCRQASGTSARGGWGDDVVGRIAQDLRADTGSARGFSRRNLFYMRRFATLWPEREKVPSVMAQIAWTSHRVLMDRFSEDPGLYAWYAAKTVANRWSVRQLQTQIHLRLHERQGAGVSNFAERESLDLYVLYLIAAAGRVRRGLSPLSSVV